eukprot:s811_g4.t1
MPKCESVDQEPGPASLSSALRLISAASTMQLHHATLEAETGAEVLLGHPCAWLHQQLSVELAIACSEWSASLLASTFTPEDSKPRLSKKQKQKMRHPGHHTAMAEENGEKNEELPELRTLIQNEFQKQSQILVAVVSELRLLQSFNQTQLMPDAEVREVLHPKPEGARPMEKVLDFEQDRSASTASDIFRLHWPVADDEVNQVSRSRET